jgi:hypothetical protein
MQDPWYICDVRKRDNGGVIGIPLRLVEFGMVFFLLVSYAKIIVMFSLQYIHTCIYLFHNTHTHTHTPFTLCYTTGKSLPIDKPRQQRAGLSGEVIKIYKYKCNLSPQTISER